MPGPARLLSAPAPPPPPAPVPGCRLMYLEDKRLDDPQYNSAEPKLGDIRSIIYLVRARSLETGGHVPRRGGGGDWRREGRVCACARLWAQSERARVEMQALAVARAEGPWDNT